MTESLPDVRLSSVFQPVFSLSHGRLVGHEALLRVHRQDGTAVPPNEYFASLACADERAAADLRSVQSHLGAYARQGKGDLTEWLLLNLHPDSLLPEQKQLAAIASAILASGIPPKRIVIEVLESPSGLTAALDDGVQALRAIGCLIAIDDFGAGHSNFERVFELAPQIVKLDRHVLLRAAQNVRSRRIVQRMVSLLHECGSLVLMEGIETLAGAHIALTCDVDLVQGYYFARPHPETLAADAACLGLQAAWNTFDVAVGRSEDRWRESMSMQSDALRRASTLLAHGHTLASACAEFLAAPGSSMCFLLDDSGQQIGEAVFAQEGGLDAMSEDSKFGPLHDCTGARWSRRTYFRRALSCAGAVQFTSPYLTLQGGGICSTASIAFECAGRLVILCGDLVVGGPGTAP